MGSLRDIQAKKVHGAREVCNAGLFEVSVSEIGPDRN